MHGQTIEILDLGATLDVTGGRIGSPLDPGLSLFAAKSTASGFTLTWTSK